MNRTMSEYATKKFTETAVRKRLSEVITSVELVEEFTSNYLLHQDHIQRALLGPHDGDDWEQWRYRAEEEELGDDEVILDAAHVLWNDYTLGLSDAEVDERLVAVIVHVLMWGFDDSWYELYRVLENSVEEGRRRVGLAKDILAEDRLYEPLRSLLSALSDETNLSVIKELHPFVVKHGLRGETTAYRTARIWSFRLGDHEAAKSWSYKEAGHPMPS